jgi:hypothetical protein
MLQVKVGLVDTTGMIDSQTMVAAAAALNVQVTRDVPQFWNINATVSYLPDPKSIPQGVWPVQLVKSLPPPEGGFHQTKNHQPYAKVIATPGSNEWTIDASHETVEMLIDPNGNRLQTSTAIGIVGGAVKDIVGKFEYLVEACDPCEANNFAYPIDGIMVSDFLTPHYYDLATTPGARYSFTGAIKTPREMLPGGYISYIDPQSDEVQQILWLGARPTVRNLGPVPPNMSLRVFVESETLRLVHKKRKTASKNVAAARDKYRASLASAARARAKHYV